MAWDRARPTSGSARFLLPDGAPAGASVRVDGAWWRADLRLDGEPLASVTPGPAPAELTLPALGAGAHRLDVVVSRPAGEHKALTLANKHTTPQRGSYRLHLGGGGVDVQMALPLVGGELRPEVRVTGAPDGATLELEVSLDGERLQRWADVPIGEPLPPRRWRERAWSIAAPALYVATATVRASDGSVVAQRGLRFGPRATGIADGRFLLNDAATPLLALRATPDEAPAAVGGLVADGALNGVELHGAIVPEAWYAVFDEWGLPVVQVVRCDGNLWAPREDPALTWRAEAATFADQDRRLVWASAARPSVVGWSCEGGQSLRELSCGGLRGDPLERPLLGVDVPGVSLSGSHAPPATGPVWVLEVGREPGKELPAPSLVTATFLRGLGSKGAGGVVPGPEATDRQSWAAAWSALAERLGAPAWSDTNRRSLSTLRVTGLAEGEVVTLAAPGLPLLGAAADAGGAATVRAWYEGDAVLTVAGVARTVRLSADRWVGMERESAAVEVDATADAAR